MLPLLKIKKKNILKDTTYQKKMVKTFAPNLILDSHSRVINMVKP